MKVNQVINEAIEREIFLGKYLVLNYSDKLKQFEKKYKLNTVNFIKQFEKGEMGDELDFFEWFALFEGKKHWENKLKQLNRV